VQVDTAGRRGGQTCRVLVVSWGSGRDRGAVLRGAVASYCGVPPGGVTIRSLCRHCGSAEHGRPIADIDTRRTPPHVSLSRARGLIVVAVTDAGPVGVDVELAGAASFPGFAEVALHPAERADDDEAATRTWVRKESLLKATGDGLQVDPRQVRLSAPGEPPAVLDWPALPGPVWLYDLGPEPGFIAAVAVLAPTRPRLVLRALEPGTSAAPAPDGSPP
jgi:4'-phosphopantetheinyl transferase